MNRPFSKNTIRLCVAPPKFCIGIFFNLSWELQSPREIKNNAYANFGGTTKSIIYGIFEKGLWLNQ